MRRREFITLVGGAAIWPVVASAQQPVIGYLSTRSPGDSGHIIAAFQKGLSEAGFISGRNLTIESRFAAGKIDRLPDLAADGFAVHICVGSRRSRCDSENFIK